MQSIASHAEKIKAQLNWKVGDFVIIDNQMAKHARDPFEGTTRKIYASLMKGESPIK